MSARYASASRQVPEASTLISTVLAGILVAGVGTAAGAEPQNPHLGHEATKAAVDGHPAAAGPRTLTGYVDQEKFFLDYLRKNHPIFADYQKSNRRCVRASRQPRGTVVADVTLTAGLIHPRRGLLAIHCRASATVAKCLRRFPAILCFLNDQGDSGVYSLDIGVSGWSPSEPEILESISLISEERS